MPPTSADSPDAKSAVVKPPNPPIHPAVFGRPAHAWHSRRRLQLLKHPGVRSLIREGAGRQWHELSVTFFVTALVLALHASVAFGLREWSPSVSTLTLSFVVFVLAATVGGLCAFALQALNHELSHAVLWVHGGPGSIERHLAWAFGLALCSTGASLCHVPWAAYYFGGGHGRHHRWAGSASDVDADALFYLWNPPLVGAFGRFCWITFAATMVPVAYAVSLLSFAIRHPAANVAELRLVLLQICLTIKACSVVGRAGSIYWWLSSCFSMGFCCHPLAGFWILQHLCVGGVQPTVSYNGSTLWNWLTLNELLHVEHHDLSRLSWRHLPRLRKEAPELYDGLYVESSVTGLLLAWLRGGSLTPGSTQSGMDFGCRTAWGCRAGQRPPAYYEECGSESEDAEDDGFIGVEDDDDEVGAEDDIAEGGGLEGKAPVWKSESRTRKMPRDELVLAQLRQRIKAEQAAAARQAAANPSSPVPSLQLGGGDGARIKR